MSSGFDAYAPLGFIDAYRKVLHETFVSPNRFTGLHPFPLPPRPLREAATDLDAAKAGHPLDYSGRRSRH